VALSALIISTSIAILPPMKTIAASGLYKPRDSKPFQISQKSVELFMECPRCFFLEKREGVRRTVSGETARQSAIPQSIRLEFDRLRAGQAHPPLMNSAGFKPYFSEDLTTWRSSEAGVTHHDRWTNFIVSAPLDDVWTNLADELVLVGLSATPPPSARTGLDQRRIEMPLWILRQQEIKVSSQAVWIYPKTEGAADIQLAVAKLKVSDGWVRTQLATIKDCLEAQTCPDASSHCTFCKHS
jgi:hypothetical protein